MITTAMDTIHLFDIVRLVNGDQMIVTGIKPNRPSNPFLGILVNGKGAEYKFGPRFNPVVIGHADQNHPALAARRDRLNVDNLTPGAAMIHQLLQAVEEGDFSKAKILTAAIRTVPQYRKNS